MRMARPFSFLFEPFFSFFKRCRTTRVVQQDYFASLFSPRLFRLSFRSSSRVRERESSLRSALASQSISCHIVSDHPRLRESCPADKRPKTRPKAPISYTFEKQKNPTAARNIDFQMAKPSRSSRKNKKAWRRNVDASDLESGLERKAAARIAAATAAAEQAAADAELFFVDKDAASASAAAAAATAAKTSSRRL